MASFEDFKKIELKIATITEVKDHPDAEKLYVIIIEVGGQTKQVVAGIKKFYKKEDLIGKQVVVVYNLDSMVLRGVESQGMILAAQDEQGICIITPGRQMKTGSIVK